VGGRPGHGIALALLAALTLAAGAAAGEAPAEAPRAADGRRVIQALERAPLGGVGVVRVRRGLDGRAWRATLELEQVLVGEARPGEGVDVVWEELAASRAPRLAPGDRVLVALEPIPDGSLWRARVPPTEREGVWHLADRGEAFLRAPTPGGLRLLDHYLRLAPADRLGAAGTAPLARLAARAELPLALSAVAALVEPLRDPRTLGPGPARDVVAALERPDEALREALLALASKRSTPALRQALRARVEAEAAPPPVLVEALGRAEGELEGERAQALLEDPAPARRAAAARHAPAAAAGKLAELVGADRAPEVRAAAAERLLELRGAAGMDAALEALGDPAKDVRLRTARAFAELGPEAVEPLGDVARRWPQPAPQAAILALSLMQRPEALPVLEELADEHPDPAVRRLAEIALGRDVGHRHGE
jgi:hypothetical protein